MMHQKEQGRYSALRSLAGRHAEPDQDDTAPRDVCGDLRELLQNHVRPETLDKIEQLVQADMGPKGHQSPESQGVPDEASQKM